MNATLKTFLRVISTLCLWGGPILAVLLVVGNLLSGADPGMVAVLGMASLYLLVIAFLIGGVLRLLLSIDDRLGRLEGDH